MSTDFDALKSIYSLVLIISFVTAQLENMIYIESAGAGEDDQDVTLFNISAISAATNNFSPDNQIGQGGFGPVYQVTISCKKWTFSDMLMPKMFHINAV